MKWEYKTINIMPNLTFTSKKFEKNFKPLMDEELKTAGEEGWEFVSSLSYDRGTKFLLIFKRPIIDSEKDK